jgi:hypothetical protein
VKRPKYLRPKPKVWDGQLRLPLGDQFDR